MQVKSLSRARLLATPWSAAHQAPPPVGFSRQEYWTGVPLPSPKERLGSMKIEKKLSRLAVMRLQANLAKSIFKK